MTQEEHDRELCRWQDAIREKLIKLSGASDQEIDGAGCDSGDPLDFTLTEIGQAFAHVEETARNANPLTEPCRARDADPSYHVSYAINEDSGETENLTHAQVVDAEAIDERGDRWCGWIAQFDDGDAIELLVSDTPEEGWRLHHKLSIRTAEQLSDMFARIASAGRERMITTCLLREAEEERIAQLDARQGRLPLEGAVSGDANESQA